MTVPGKTAKLLRKRVERVKGIEPSFRAKWFFVVQSSAFMGVFAFIFRGLLALLALDMAYLYRKARSPFWYVVYLDSNQKERHRSTGLRADDPNDTAKAKAMLSPITSKGTTQGRNSGVKITHPSHHGD